MTIGNIGDLTLPALSRGADEVKDEVHSLGWILVETLVRHKM